ncbi:hypothetical protein ACQZ46_13770 [Agrobacterium salinitolerans]|uniref:Uncharacterized protein n=1 Tax=Agrobacterium salinitolerans TaxID=1183413 RepID=A0ABY3BLH1_9HYPH|nr:MULTISPECIES: hypothetical protein [Agrobacterium]MCZ7851538.1 hypothetical protein [Agrobacterium salinitolerans]MCZ7894294.1 hypothetical protein [Agrobacterium salinitolerans]MCZ7977572.1 hypothetical protein [Agrobacterium salinitolerans]TRA87020.1 hypothetical protein EXN23_18510 [Agrobacterium salinitolerans]
MSDERNEVTEDYPAVGEACRAELHKMAEQAADPALMEMFEIVGERRRRNRAATAGGNVAIFPHLRTRQPGEAPPFALGEAAEKGRNILPFRWTRRR